MLHQRGAGVLMHISSLPSPYGIGVFDRHARDFIDRIADMGFTYWQVLPFNPIDGAGSPYCSPSAFAGNYLFIDPQGLLDMGLATAEEVAANRYDGTPYTADFAFAGERRLALLEQALGTLEEQARRIVLLHAVTGLKHREIAQLLELPLATVLSKYHRALKKLKAQLEGDDVR